MGEVFVSEGRRIRNVKKGDVLNLRDREYTVTSVYPYMCIGESKKNKKAFTIGELVCMHIEPTGCKEQRNVKYVTNTDYDFDKEY